MAKEFNINALLNRTIVLPPVGPFPKPDQQPVNDIGGEVAGDVKESALLDKQFVTLFATPQILPLQFKLSTESDWWLFPIEPLISIEAKNEIATRNVAKKRDGYGSVKEYWTKGDYKITISGLFTNAVAEAFPNEDLQQLYKYCETPEPVEVKNTLLLELGVTHIVVESYALPFTKGNENQRFSISAVSDKNYDLFIPLEGNLN